MTSVGPAARPRESGPAEVGISRALTWLLAVACGVSAANLYYAQPLLSTLAHDFHVGTGTAGLIVTASQVGYAVSLAFVVPLGDILERRTMVIALASLSVVALLAAAASPNVGVLIALSALIGISATVAQTLVPLAASLAHDPERGRVVGRVMSGLLTGILLARTVSGLIANVAGWRAVYITAAGLEVVLIAVLSRALPRERVARESMSYLRLLRSLGDLVLHEPLLIWRTVLGALAFACFGILWTTLAFLLRGSPYHYSDGVIGLFGLVGAGGAVAATFAGRAADRGHVRLASFVFAASILVSFGLLALGRHDLTALIVGIVLLDIGVQGLQVNNQSVIYEIAPNARSRINGVYMTGYFIGGAVGSALASAIYETSGWSGVCILGAATSAIATVAAAFRGPADHLSSMRPRRHTAIAMSQEVKKSPTMP